MCSTGPFQLMWLKGYIYSSCYYHHQIGSINLTHCYHFFPWLCAWDVCCIIFCHLLHIHSGKTGVLFSLLLCSLWWVQIVGCVLACRSHSFVCINIILLSSLCKLIWRHWTYKMPVKYGSSSVSVRLSIFSQLFIIQYTGLCVFGLSISLVMIEIIYTFLSYHHHQIGRMNCYPLFRFRLWDNGVHCMSFYILMKHNDLIVTRHQCMKEIERLYLTGVIAAKLRRYLSNINVIFNSWPEITEWWTFWKITLRRKLAK